MKIEINLQYFLITKTMATNAQITKINAQNFHFDDKWVTPRSNIRRKRMQHRKVGKLRAPKKPPMHFSERWAAIEIQRVWRGHLARA